MIDLSKPDQFVAYFENIATNIKLLSPSEPEKHFYPVDVYELFDGFRTKLKDQALVSMYKTSDIKGKGQNINEVVQGIVWIIGHVSRSNDNKLSQLLLCKTIGYQLLAKMQKDSKDYELLGFDLEKVNITQIGPVEVNWYGYRYEFNIPIRITSEVCYDPDNYTF